MSVGMRITTQGMDEIQRVMRNISPKLHPQIQRRAFSKAARLIQKDAAKVQIKAGGGGKNNARAPLKDRLTSRTGTLRRSIRVNKAPLPHAIHIGTDLGYGAVHESGGTVTIGSATVKAHTRSVAFGRKVKPFNVPSHTRKAHKANFPQRPFLAPALRAIGPQIPHLFIVEWKRALDGKS